MAVEFTKEQRQAIESRGGSLIVAAAAGSGKTAVLVERVIRRLLEPEGLGKLVIQMEKSPEGALHVVLQASNETALQMLKDHSGSLGLMLQNSQAAPVRLEVQRQDNPEQNPWNQQEQNQNQNHSQQQQQQRRQENRQSEDFLQKLRLGLMPA